MDWGTVVKEIVMGFYYWHSYYKMFKWVRLELKIFYEDYKEIF